MPTQPFLLAGLIAAAIVQVGLIAISWIPLGIPGEWQWQRHAFASSVGAAGAQFLPAIFGIITLLSVAKVGNSILFQHHTRSVSDKRSQQHGPTLSITVMLLCLLVVGSWVWLKTVERCSPAPHRNLKSLWVLYDPSLSDSFHEAAFNVDSAAEVLSSYEARMQDGGSHQLSTHPPGLFLMSRWAISFCESVPFVSARLNRWTLRSNKEVFRSKETSAALERPLTNPELAALSLMSELATLAAALTIIPLYYLLRRCFNALIAWRAVTLWATVPCLVVFLPKSDVLFTLTSMSAVCLGSMAIASSADMRKRFGFAVASGIVLWCGLMLSLAHLAVLVFLGAVFAVRMIRGDKSRRTTQRFSAKTTKQGIAVLATIIGTIVVASVAFSVATGCNMFSVWQLNFSNHAGFSDHHTRTAWKWLLVNPLELSMAIGMPLIFAGCVGLRFAVDRHRTQSASHRDSRTLAVDLSLAVVLTVGLLWLSCCTRGELARQWCFLTPWLILLPAHLIRQESKANGVSKSSTIWQTLLFAQMAVCVLTAARVCGFPL